MTRTVDCQTFEIFQRMSDAFDASPSQEMVRSLNYDGPRVVRMIAGYRNRVSDERVDLTFSHKKGASSKEYQM